MVLNKIIGYLLLVVGLVIIGWTLYQSYNIFIGKVSAPIIFKTPITQKNLEKSNVADLQQQLERTVQKQITELLPSDTVPKILNLLSWSILAGILILGGSQIAGLGIKIIKQT